MQNKIKYIFLFLIQSQIYSMHIGKGFKRLGKLLLVNPQYLNKPKVPATIFKHAIKVKKYKIISQSVEESLNMFNELANEINLSKQDRELILQGLYTKHHGSDSVSPECIDLEKKLKIFKNTGCDDLIRYLIMQYICLHDEVPTSINDLLNNSDSTSIKDF